MSGSLLAGLGGRAAFVGAWLLFALALFAHLIAYDVRVYDSDYLFLPTLYRDVTAWGGAIGEWRLPSVPFVLPDLALYFALAPLFPSFHWTLLAYGVAQWLLLMGGWALLISRLPEAPTQRRLRQQLSLMGAAGLLALPLLRPLAALPFVSLNHFGVLVALPYLLCLVLALRGRWRGWALAWLVLLSLAMSGSDTLFVVQGLIAAAVALLLMGWRRWLAWRWVGAGLLALGLGGGVGSLLAQLLVPYPNLNEMLGVAPSAARSRAAAQALWGWLRAWSQQSPASAAMVGASLSGVALCTLWAAWTLRRQPHQQAEATLILGLFALASAGATVLAAVVMGVFLDGGSARYLQSLTQLPLYMLPLLVPLHGRWAAMGRGAALLLALLVLLWAFPQVGQAKQMARYNDFYPAEVACLDQTLAARGLHVGVGSYWDAKLLTMLSHEGLRVLQVSGALEPYHWISNLQWYQRVRPDFILVGSPAGPGLYVAEERVVGHFGDPAARWDCGSWRVLAYDRPQDARFHFALSSHPMAQDFSRVGAQATYTAAALPGDIGQGVGAARVAGVGEFGFLSYGPYVPLPSGQYEATFRYEWLPQPGESSRADVTVTVGDQSVTIAEAGLDPLAHEQRIFFTLETAGRVELRMWHNGAGTLTVHDIALLRAR